MNLLLLEQQNFISDKFVKVTGYHHQHIRSVLKATIGDTINVGVINGKIGIAHITSISQDSTQLEVSILDKEPPATIPLTIILGLPRPRMLQRTLQTIATMGVQKLCLIQTSRVEKSFWQTPLLKPETVREHLILGLEQGKASQLPEIEMHQRFRPFIEDALPSILKQQKHQNKIIAHPGDYPLAKSVDNQSTILVIGPEGGFLQKEVKGFIDQGFDPVQLGQRILRVETAIPVLIGKLY